MPRELLTTEELLGEESVDSFDRALENTLKREGGKTVDHAGPTNFGITQTTYDNYSKSKGLPVRDVFDIETPEVKSIAREIYFDKPGFNKLPGRVGEALFDFGFNASPRTAIKAIQRIIGTTDDGIIGPKTISSVNKYIENNGEDDLLQKTVDSQKSHYKKLIEENPKKFKKFENGWMNRIQSIKDQFNLSSVSDFFIGNAEAAEEESNFENNGPEILTTEEITGENKNVTYLIPYEFKPEIISSEELNKRIQESPEPTYKPSPGLGEVFMAHLLKESPAGIATRVASQQPFLTPEEEELSAEYPVAAMAGGIAGGLTSLLSILAIPGVGLPVAFGASGALGKEAELAEKAKENFNDTLSTAKSVGQVAVTGVAQGITGKIFSQAQAGKTVLDRIITRSMGAGANSITESIVNQTISEDKPNVEAAIIAGGLNAVQIGILGVMVEIPQFRGLVIKEGSSLAKKQLNYEQAKAVLKKAGIDQNRLSPEWQQSQRDIKKKAVLENIKAKVDRFGVPEDIIISVINEGNVRVREGILTDYLSSLVKTDPIKAKQLLPFFEAIKNGADPVDILIAQELASKIKPSTVIEETIKAKPEEKPPEAPAKAVTEPKPSEAVLPKETQPKKIPQGEKGIVLGEGQVATTEESKLQAEKTIEEAEKDKKGGGVEVVSTETLNKFIEEGEKPSKKFTVESTHDTGDGEEAFVVRAPDEKLMVITSTKERAEQIAEEENKKLESQKTAGGSTLLDFADRLEKAGLTRVTPKLGYLENLAKYANFHTAEQFEKHLDLKRNKIMAGILKDAGLTPRDLHDVLVGQRYMNEAREVLSPKSQETVEKEKPDDILTKPVESGLLKSEKEGDTDVAEEELGTVPREPEGNVERQDRERNIQREPPSFEPVQSGIQQLEVSPNVRPVEAGKREETDPAGNYRISAEDQIGQGTAKIKYRNNIKAIKLLKIIEKENRKATEEEKQILVQYTGWGGLSQAFDYYNDKWRSEYNEIKELLSDDELSEARKSTINAHYTSPEVIRSMWAIVEKLGFRGGRVLEPAMGVGHFFGLRPTGMRFSLSGVELDSLTGRIAQQLYQDADIQVKGFQDVQFPRNYFDIVISNVPFADYKPFDPKAKEMGIPEGLNLHDFFFAKSIALLKQNGIIAFITSKGTLDKTSQNLRDYIVKNADFIGAMRLPSTAFKENAGTEVVTDVIFLRKRLSSDKPSNIAWTKLKEARISNRPYLLNEYFVDNPEMVLGYMKIARGLYSDSELRVDPFDVPLQESMMKASEKFPQSKITDDIKDYEEKQQKEIIRDTTELMQGSFVIKDGKIFRKIEGDQLEEQSYSPESSGRIKGMINLKNMSVNLLAKQIQGISDADLKSELKTFNSTYDAFVKKYGFLNDRKNATLFRKDPMSARLLSLETEEGKTYKKSGIFVERVINPHVLPKKAESNQEAVSISLSEYGKLNWNYMSDITGKNIQELQSELLADRQVFRDPSGDVLVLRDEYLSGNVKLKLEEAKIATKADKAFASNVEELQNIIPKDLTFDKIVVNVGATWVDVETYREFVGAMLGINRHSNDLHVSWNKIGGWNMSLSQGSWARNSSENTAKWGTSRYPAIKLFEDIANGRLIQVKDTVRDENGEERRILNIEETNNAQEKAEILKRRFASWFWDNPERQEKYIRIYNDRFNNIVNRKNDGSHLTFPGLNPSVKLRKSQIDAIWRTITSNRIMLAHEVGAGKTFIGIISLHESKRLGLINKPYLIVPPNTLPQWERAWNNLYPMDNILVADPDNFQKKERQLFLSMAANGNWDAIIIPFSSNELIGVFPETQVSFLEDNLNALRDFKESQKESGKKISVKNIEKSILSLEQKIKKILNPETKDLTTKFEELGVDAVLIDEADYYKNLPYQTQLEGVKGMGTASGSDKTLDMLMKIKDVQKKNGKIIFATGTPISNSLVEVHAQMRYLQPELLKEKGLESFDSWQKQFVEVVNSLEVSAAGTYQMSQRLSKFINLPELMQMLREIWDIQTGGMLEEQGILVPGKNLPFIQGGTPEMKVFDATPELDQFIKLLGERADAIKGKKAEKGGDNMLVIMRDGRVASIDMRMIDPNIPSNPNSKLEIATQNIIDIWEKTKADKLTQLVFIDMVKPDRASPFNPHYYMKRKFMEAGIPEKEIAFIHDYPDPKDKEMLYDKVNGGDVRIVFGSTEKLGAGTNIQKLLYAEHHIDIPMRPRDITQREGRIVRPGNTNKTVRIIRYSAKGSLDPFMWQMLEAKDKAINMIMAGSSDVREYEEDVNEYALLKAASSRNPLVAEKVMLERDLMVLQSLKNSFIREKIVAANKIKEITIKISKDREDDSNIRSDISKRPTKPTKENFTILIDGENYTDKEEAWKALKIAGERSATEGTITIGKYLGYDISILKHVAGTDIYIKGAHRYYAVLSESPIGTFASIDHAIFETPETLLKAMESSFPHYEKELQINKELSVKTFPKENEFEEKIKREQEVNRLLRKESEDKRAGEEPGDDIVELHAGLPLLPKLKQRVVDDTVILTPTLLDPKVEKRFVEANGQRRHPDVLKTKIKNFIVEIYNQWTRVNPELPNDPKYADIRQILAKQSRSRVIVNDKAIRIIDDITYKMGAKKLDLFTRKVVLDDLVREATAGRPVPFGYSEYDENGVLSINLELLKADKENVDRIVELNPDVKDAVLKRDMYMKVIQEELVKRGILDEDQVKEDYYRHQVLEHANAKATFGTGRKLRTPSPGYARRRYGSTMDINTNYLESEFEVMSNALYDIETSKNINEIRTGKHNIKKQLQDKAREANNSAISVIQVNIGGTITPLRNLLKPFNQKMAWNFKLLEKLGYIFIQGDPGTFTELARLSIDKDVTDDVRISAKTILKAVAERKQFIRASLGTRYKEWDDFIPEGYTTWQPKEGRVFFMAFSVPQRIVDKVMDGMDIGIDKSDLRKLMVVGNKEEEFVLPQEVADTLDNLYSIKPENWLSEASKYLTTSWKKYILMNPRRLFKYNYQNFIGDCDAVIAGNPKIFKYFSTAINELNDMFYKGKPMADKMREFFERGGLTTTLTLQEIPDINTLEVFTRLQSNAEKSFTLDGAKGIMHEYWNRASQFTVYRESILRYAAYLHYRDVFTKGGAEYGASNPEEIKALPDPKDKAAKVATELLGDYTNISKLGKEMREHVIPFYSWWEINFKRYVQLSKNAYGEGAGKGLKMTAKLTALGASKTTIMGSLFLLKWLIRASLLTSIMALWNQLRFPREEESLSTYDKNRMHLILGRDKDGNIIMLRGQGAFSDLLEWVGMNEIPTLMREYFDGKASLEDIGKSVVLQPALKFFRGITPFYKMPFEQISGNYLPVFDDRSGKIEDRWRHLARSVNIENEYDALMKEPSRGYARSIKEAFITTTDPEENAYRYIQAEKYKYIERVKGVSDSSQHYSPKSILYRKYRRALLYKDDDAIKKIRGEMEKIGVTSKQNINVIKSADPLSGLNRADEQDFINNYLTVKDRVILERAKKYYKKTFQGE